MSVPSTCAPEDDIGIPDAHVSEMLPSCAIDPSSVRPGSRVVVRRSLCLAGALGLVILAQLTAHDAFAGGLVQDWVQAFADSDLVFQRGSSNVPFQPLAFVDVSFYNDAEVRRQGETALSFDQTTVSQGAALPFLASQRDALLVGEWLSWTRFDARDSGYESFEVASVGLPMGWLRQVDERWQTAAFVMPLAHKASLDNAHWSWETMGGAFVRYLESDSLWWAAGLYVDVGPGDDTYLPYLGASWAITDEWTLSAVIPWPAVLYAPDQDTLFRFGAAPSGASWTLGGDGERLSFAFDSWDLGLTAERRVYGNLWVGLEAGIGGLRGLRVVEGRWEGPEFDIDASPYISLSVNLRPSLLP